MFNEALAAWVCCVLITPSTFVVLEYLCQAAFEAASGCYERPHVLMAVAHAPLPLPPATQAVTHNEEDEEDEVDEDDEDEEEEDSVDETWMYAPSVYFPGMYPEMVQCKSSYGMARFRPPSGLAGM